MEVVEEVEVGVMLQGKHGNRRETGCVRIQGLLNDIGEQLCLLFLPLFELEYLSLNSLQDCISYTLIFLAVVPM